MLSIQRVYRGYVARKLVGRLLRERFPDRRRAYCEEKMRHLADRYLQVVEHEGQEVDKLLLQMDLSMEQSRLLMMSRLDWEDSRSKVCLLPCCLPHVPVVLGDGTLIRVEREWCC